VAAALELAGELHEGTLVTVLCDSAEKYLSDSFWEES
jgi:cysteine synthase B